MENKTIDRFLSKMEKDIKEGVILAPEEWISRAIKLNAFIGSEIDEPLYLIENKLAKQKAEMFKDLNMTASKANIYIEATDEFMQTKLLRAKREQVREFIKLAKKYAEAIKEEYKYTS